MRLIVGITGATGVIYGVRLLERLRDAGVETHLVISRWGARTLAHETPYSREQVEALAHTTYAPGDMGAAISSGSFQTAGMVIVPCSAKTLGAIDRLSAGRLVVAVGPGSSDADYAAVGLGYG